MVFGVDEEDYAADFGEVVAPETTSWDNVSGEDWDGVVEAREAATGVWESTWSMLVQLGSMDAAYLVDGHPDQRL